MIAIEDVESIAIKHKEYITKDKLNDVLIISNERLKNNQNVLWSSVVENVLSVFIGDRSSNGISNFPHHKQE